MTKIPFEDGVKVSNAKVTIDGNDYNVTPAQYSGATPFSAYNLNQMQDNIETEINTTKNSLKTYVGYTNPQATSEYSYNSIELDVSKLPIIDGLGYHSYSYYEVIYKENLGNLRTTKYLSTGKIPAGNSTQLIYIDRSFNFYYRDFDKYYAVGVQDPENKLYEFSNCVHKTTSGTTETANNFLIPIRIILYP